MATDVDSVIVVVVLIVVAVIVAWTPGTGGGPAAAAWTPGPAGPAAGGAAAAGRGVRRPPGGVTLPSTRSATIDAHATIDAMAGIVADGRAWGRRGEARELAPLSLQCERTCE